MQTFFKRHGKSLTIRTHDSAYAVGDIVTWILPENLPHIDMVIAQVDATTGNPMIVNYIGFAPKIDDMIFDYGMAGHYRFEPSKYNH